jgi:hypothetical protein
MLHISPPSRSVVRVIGATRCTSRLPANEFRRNHRYEEATANRRHSPGMPLNSCAPRGPSVAGFTCLPPVPPPRANGMGGAAASCCRSRSCTGCRVWRHTWDTPPPWSLGNQSLLSPPSAYDACSTSRPRWLCSRSASGCLSSEPSSMQTRRLKGGLRVSGSGPYRKRPGPSPDAVAGAG